MYFSLNKIVMEDQFFLGLGSYEDSSSDENSSDSESSEIETSGSGTDLLGRKRIVVKSTAQASK